MNAARVASGSFRYPVKTDAPRTCSSPSSPGGAADPSSRTTRSSVPGLGRPVVSARTGSASASRVYAPACSSVMPQSCITLPPRISGSNARASAAGTALPDICR